MRPLAFKLLTFALAVFLLLSVLLPNHVSARGRFVARDTVDEQPYPQAYRNFRYCIIITAYGAVLLPILVRPNEVSNTASTEKPTASPQANEAVD